MTIYEYTVQEASGEGIPLQQYQGKIILIVNTASACGYTPQYKELQALYNRFHHQGLEILAFPCNQFGQQEPGSNEEIQQFCQLNYGVTFKVFAKIEVNGQNAHPLYQYLRAQTGEALEENNEIKWNFTKFLIDRVGNVVARYEPDKTPASLTPDIEKLI